MLVNGRLKWWSLLVQTSNVLVNLLLHVSMQLMTLRCYGHVVDNVSLGHAVNTRPAPRLYHA